MVAPLKANLQRHNRAYPCPVCGGHAGLPQGRGIRCAGFTVGITAFCTREEYAGRALFDITKEPPAYKHILVGRCHCGSEHGYGSPVGPIPHSYGAPPQNPALELDAQHLIYSALLDSLVLRPEAVADLLRRGLTEEDIQAVGYRSIPAAGSEVQRLIHQLVDRFGEECLRRCPGFVDRNGRTGFRTAREQDGYMVPYRDENARITGLQFRLLGGKYLTARGASTALMSHVAGRPESGSDLYVTEGAVKAQVAHRLGGINVVGLPGQSLSENHVASLLRMQPGRVIVALDEERNDNTDRARDRWLRILFHAGLPTFRATWEGLDVGGPKGLDDLLFSGGRPRIRAVSFAPAGIGERRTVRPTLRRGEVADGMSLTSARGDTADAIFEFILGKRRR